MRQPAVNGGGNDGARKSFTTKAPRHQEGSGEDCLTNGVTWCLGVLVVHPVIAFRASATGRAATLDPKDFEGGPHALEVLVTRD
jgi:hypothetical protein